jgi:hypothetical protein
MYERDIKLNELLSSHLKDYSKYNWVCYSKSPEVQLPRFSEPANKGILLDIARGIWQHPYLSCFYMIGLQKWTIYYVPTMKEIQERLYRSIDLTLYNKDSEEETLVGAILNPALRFA